MKGKTITPKLEAAFPEWWQEARAWIGDEQRGRLLFAMAFLAGANAARPLKVAKGTDREPSARGVAFAEWFRTTLAAEAKLPADWRGTWAREFDAMVTLDKRSEAQIAAVCRWARADAFWQANFLSPRKLRQRKDGVMYFDRFLAAMRPAKGQKKVDYSGGF